MGQQERRRERDMALFGPSFTVQGTSYPRDADGKVTGMVTHYEGEVVRPYGRKAEVKAIMAEVRKAFTAGATSVRVTKWNNWQDNYGSTRYQSCALAYVDNGIDCNRGWLRYRRCNIF